MSPLEALQWHFDNVGEIDPIARLVTETGRRWQAAPLPATIKPYAMGPGYSQARTLALKFPRKFFYVEGYASSERFPIAMHRAWCSTKSGLVVDKSWDNPERAMYVGAAFKHSVFDEPLPDFPHWGLLRSPKFLKKVLQHPERYIEMAWYRPEDAMGK